MCERTLDKKWFSRHRTSEEAFIIVKIYSAFDPEFRFYGKILKGFKTDELLTAMSDILMPERGTAYEPVIASLEACRIYEDFQNRAYGGMPIQIGMCWGYNTKLNCLEYHRDSEVNIGSEDFILLLALQSEMKDGAIDTGKVKAFRVPKGLPVEIYATTLHYAPCHTSPQYGFRVAVVLPRGTNTEKSNFIPKCEEDTWLTARNKWLLAHSESDEAKSGAYIGLLGDNIDITEEIEQ